MLAPVRAAERSLMMMIKQPPSNYCYTEEAFQQVFVAKAEDTLFIRLPGI
jgi:hypothetical protein